jgi:hypothetical protein
MRALTTLVFLALWLQPAQAQTDDRILNDVFAVLEGQAILNQSRQLCLDFADTDLEADLADWSDRNARVLREANLLVIQRPGLEPGMLEVMRDEAASEASRSFARETDRPGYCENLGETIAAEGLELGKWFPRETTRISEAVAGKWPPLDLADVPAIAEAMEVKQLFFAMQDGLVRCGVLFPPAEPYAAAYSEWEARNSYTRDLADRVLKNWGALHPQRWADARDEAGAIVDRAFEDKPAAEAYCLKTAADAGTGTLDIDQQRRDLYDSVMANAEVMP